LLLLLLSLSSFPFSGWFGEKNQRKRKNPVNFVDGMFWKEMEGIWSALPLIPLIPLIPLSAALADRVRLRNWITRHFRMENRRDWPEQQLASRLSHEAGTEIVSYECDFRPTLNRVGKNRCAMISNFSISITTRESAVVVVDLQQSSFFFFFLITFSIFDFLWSDPMAFSAAALAIQLRSTRSELAWRWRHRYLLAFGSSRHDELQ